MKVSKNRIESLYNSLNGLCRKHMLARNTFQNKCAILLSQSFGGINKTELHYPEFSICNRLKMTSLRPVFYVFVEKPRLLQF